MAKKTKSPEPSATAKKGFGYYFKRVFLDSCVYYTIIVIALMTINLLMQTEDSRDVIYSVDFLGLYPFAFLIGCANLIFSNKKLKLGLRVALHAVCVLGGFAIYMATIKKADGNAIAKMSVAMVVVYVIILIAVITVLALKAKKAREVDSEYKNVYEDITSEKGKKKQKEPSLSELEEEVFTKKNDSEDKPE